uniref:RBBP8 N-terminal like n=1 Tax=Otus sunia TaxID=257818 RepID=A0A8C8AZW8_9STRI
MTAESFAEFLNKLKEIHEKEVQGLQSKLTELTTEKCRDAQRIEELFAKNHQLREQQKALKENVKVLENRLRAGLCDRCMVTQELAKKKQNEYESSHFQSLKHIFILTNETNRLREENKTLKEELKTLRTEQLTWTFSPLPQASQRVANQLHGTIALVRPGSRPCFLEKCPLGAAVSPPARKTPLPPEHEHSPSLEAYLTASKPDSPKVAPSYENLKLTTRREQLCLLHKHLSLHQLGLASNCASADRDGSSFSSHLLRTKDADSRTRSRDSWEDRATLLKLPAAMVYVRDQQLEEKLHLLKHRERLQHFLMQRCQPGQRADGDPKPLPEERPLSPWPNITAGCKEERSFLEDAADGKEEKELWLSRDSSELQEKVKATRDDGADAPLDLSDSGRGRETGWHSRREPWGASSPQPSPGESPAGSAAHGPSKRHEAERDNLRFPYCWPNRGMLLPATGRTGCSPPLPFFILCKSPFHSQNQQCPLSGDTQCFPLAWPPWNMGARFARAGGRQQPWGAERGARLLRAARYRPYWLGQKVELTWISWSGRVRAVWEHSPEQDFAWWKKKKKRGVLCDLYAKEISSQQKNFS